MATPSASFALRGGVVYGGSAGAIVLGANISTCAHMDHNDVGITDMHGLDLLDGHAVWCHYQAADYPALPGLRPPHTHVHLSSWPRRPASGVGGQPTYVSLSAGPLSLPLLTGAMVALIAISPLRIPRYHFANGIVPQNHRACLPERTRPCPYASKFAALPPLLNPPTPVSSSAGQAIVRSAAALGISALRECRIVRLYFLEQDPGPEALQRLCAFLLADPVLERAAWGPIDREAEVGSDGTEDAHVVEVAYRPGVTDVAARELARGMVEIGLPACEVATGTRYELTGDLAER